MNAGMVMWSRIKDLAYVSLNAEWPTLLLYSIPLCTVLYCTVLQRMTVRPVHIWALLYSSSFLAILPLLPPSHLPFLSFPSFLVHITLAK